MKNSFFLALVLLLLGVMAPRAEAGYATGQDLTHNCESQAVEGLYSCMNYIAGIIDYHLFMQSMGADTAAKFCVPKDASLEELSVVVLRYLKTVPEQQAFIAASSVLMALQTAYPCSN